MNVLKLIFGPRQNGAWPIQNMGSLPLAPGGKDAADFYRVRDDLFVVEPNYISTISSTMGQSVVPVVAFSPGDDLVRCLGTGFFVSCSGLLITAAHVITDPIEGRYGGVHEVDEWTWSMGDLVFGVMIRMNPVFQSRGYSFRPIEWAGFLGTRTEHPLPIRGMDLRLSSDTAICKVASSLDGSPYQPLPIVQPGIRGTGLAVGKRATAVGYAGMQRDISLRREESGGRTSAELRFDLHVSEGKILEHFAENAQNRDVSTPGACFSASLKLPSGMSGGPIFDDEGIYVHGVVSKGWDDESGLANLGYGSMLAESLVRPIAPLGNKSLLELMGTDEHGIPKMNIAGA